MAGISISILFACVLYTALPTDILLFKPVFSGEETPVYVTGRLVTEDSLVNYCNLVQAAFFYGLKFGDKKQGLSTEDVAFYNDMWREVFNVASYQIEIDVNEFVLGAKFGEGNHSAFPPSSLYDEAHADTYYLFHLVKEIGMVHSTYFSKCPSCVDYSLAKINAYLNVLPIRSQVPQIWSATNTYKKLSTITELDEFWELLKCLHTDGLINPKQDTDNGEQMRSCNDTMLIATPKDMSPYAVLSWQRCDDTVSMDTLGPTLIIGIDGTHGATYRVTFIAKSKCIESDTCHQYFVIQ